MIPVTPADTVLGCVGVADELPHPEPDVDAVVLCLGSVGLPVVADADVGAAELEAVELLAPDVPLLEFDGERVRVLVGVGQTGELDVDAAVVVVVVTGRVFGVLPVGCPGEVDGARVGDERVAVGDDGCVLRGCDGAWVGCLVGLDRAGWVGDGRGLTVDVGPIGRGAFAGSGGMAPGSRPPYNAAYASTRCT